MQVIMLLTCKTIGLYLKTDTVACDFDINTNEILVFKKDSIEFTDKSKFNE